MEVVQIICPQCAVILRVKNPQNKTEKLISCPKCGKKILIRFKSQSTNEVGETQYRDNNTAGTTQLVDLRVEQKSCMLVHEGKEYELSLGSNTIGRKATSSSADIQFDIDDRYMSRNHSLINVRRLPNGNLKADISNSRNKNATMVNGNNIEDGDVIVLHDGDTITMGRTTFIFKAK